MFLKFLLMRLIKCNNQWLSKKNQDNVNKLIKKDIQITKTEEKIYHLKYDKFTIEKPIE